MENSGNPEDTIRRVGVIAHDFNNLFTAINGYADLAQSQLPPESPAFAFLEEVRRAGARASDLNRELLALSRSQAEPALQRGPGKP